MGNDTEGQHAVHSRFDGGFSARHKALVLVLENRDSKNIWQKIFVRLSARTKHTSPTLFSDTSRL